MCIRDRSKPEMAETPALEADDDTIDGAELPVGEHEAVAKKSAGSHAAPVVDEAATASAAGAVSHKEGGRNAAPLRGTRVAVPNFDSFRKKLLLGLLGGGLLVAFLVWAIVLAPSARIIITARTTDAALNSRVNLLTTGKTDLKAGTIVAVMKSTKKDISVPIVATGKKDVGEKATGSVTLYNDSFDPITVSGTVTAGGFNFVLSSPITVPKGSCLSLIHI